MCRILRIWIFDFYLVFQPTKKRMQCERAIFLPANPGNPQSSSRAIKHLTAMMMLNGAHPTPPQSTTTCSLEKNLFINNIINNTIKIILSIILPLANNTIKIILSIILAIIISIIISRILPIFACVIGSLPKNNIVNCTKKEK